MIVEKIRSKDGEVLWIEVLAEDGAWRAQLKWDGCVHLYQRDGGKDLAYIHLCGGLNGMLDVLGEMKKVALEAFKNNTTMYWHE